jgi:transposase
MSCILPKLSFFVKQRLLQNFPHCRDAGTRIRYLVLLQLDAGRSPPLIAAFFQIHRATVYRVAKRFRHHGESSLCDRRAHNGPQKLTPDFLTALDRLVRGSPQDHGWRRPTWTRELLLATLRRLGHAKVHVATLSRALQRIRARRGRPRPTVGCPWPKSRKTRRLNEIRRLVENLPKDEMAFYEDEVDIHLNPKIGYDWMGRGQQKEVRTPGQNHKRYLAGAWDVRSGAVVWVAGDKKDSWLFVRLLGKLYQHYPKAKAIHVILDNYKIHDSKLVAWALLEAGGRIRLEFLPPYCPKHNKIERVWEDLHAAVTRNHTCPDRGSLLREVRHYLRCRNRQVLRRLAAANKPPTEGS